MEYFTLANDLEGIQSLRNKKRNRILVGIVLVASFFVFRALGVIVIESNKSYFNGKHKAQKTIQALFVDNGKNMGTISNKTNTLENNDKDSFGKLAINLKLNAVENQNIDERYLENLIKTNLSKDKTLKSSFEFANVYVRRFEMSGLYWLPIIKKGANSYQIYVENTSKQGSYSAEFIGETDLEVHGFCTVHKLKQVMADKIAKIVISSIKDDYKK